MADTKKDNYIHKCPDCFGVGMVTGGRTGYNMPDGCDECYACGGSGRIFERARDNRGKFIKRVWETS